MVSCAIKNEYQKDMCFKRIQFEVHAQNVLTILNSIVNMLGRPIWPLMYTKSTSLWEWKDICMSSENNETNDYGHDFIILAHLLHVSYPTKVDAEKSIWITHVFP